MLKSVPVDNTQRDTGQLFPERLESLPPEESLKKTFGAVLFKPDSIELEVYDFVLQHIINKLREYGIVLAGVVKVPPMTREQVESLYPGLAKEYLDAHIDTLGQKETLIAVFEGRTDTVDIWEKIRELKGKIGNGYGIEDSVRAMVPLPGEEDEFNRVHQKVVNGEILDFEDYKNLARNLIHSPDTAKDFRSIVRLVSEEQLGQMFGVERSKALREYLATIE